MAALLSIEELFSALKVMESRVKNRDILPILKGTLDRGVLIETFGFLPDELKGAIEVFDLYQRGRRQETKSMLWALGKILDYTSFRIDRIQARREDREVRVAMDLLHKVGHEFGRSAPASTEPVVNFNKKITPASKAEVVEATKAMAKELGTRARVGEATSDKIVAGRFRNLASEALPRVQKLGSWQQNMRLAQAADQLGRTG